MAPKREGESAQTINVNVCYGHDDRLVTALHRIARAILAHATLTKEGFVHMSEAAQNLTAIVNLLVEEFQILNSTVDTEVVQILENLSNAGDAELRQAVDASLPRLQNLIDSVRATQQRIGQIVPDDQPPLPEANQ